MEEIIKRYRTYIRESANYGEFHQYLKNLTNHEKGVLQELLAKQYFTVYAKLYDVDRYCARILGDVMPSGVNDTDLGSDGVIVHTDGRISLVQVKFRKDWEHHLNRLCLSGMSLEALALGDMFANLYLFSNTLFTPRNLSTREIARVKFVLADKLMECDWDLIRACDIFTDTHADVVEIPPLRDWQVRAREFVLSPDVIANSGMFGRKTVVAACGAGKTLFTNSLLDEWYGSILILVPNLHLLSQWFEKLALWRPDYHFLLVGSDLDDEGTRVPYNLTTDVEVIANVYAEHMLNIICISTYQSLPRLIETESAHFDLCVCDEAHITAGSSGVYSLPTQEHFIAENILYITATPRIYGGARKETYRSMDDEDVYGPQFLYSFRQAINEGIISDYRIIVGQGQGRHDNTVFNAKFLKRSIVREGLNSVLVFSSSHAQSQELYAEFKRIFKGDHALILMPPGANSFRKAQVIHKLNTGSPVVIFNVRVFNLGSDLVPLQAVMLSGNKGSVTDIIQSVSRCLRLHPDKEYGTILVPCLVETEDFNGPGTFARLRSFLSAIASVDDSIKEEIILRAQRKEVDRRKIYTDMVMRSSEDITDNVDFDVRMYTSIGKSVGFSPELRFALLKEFCEKEGRLPKAKEEHAGVKIGQFFDSLLGGKVYTKTRDTWIQRLRDIPDVADELSMRIFERADETKKTSRTISPVQRFVFLREFCENEGRLPIQSETYADAKIGQFLNHLLSGNMYAKTRNTWIQALLDIPEITDVLNSRISGRADETKKTSRSASPAQRFALLKDFCITKGRLPTWSESYANVKIGQFLNMLLGSKYYMKVRDVWIRELLDIPEIAEMLNMRISGRTDETRKASRAVPPAQRFALLKKFCINENRLPTSKEKYMGVNIGMLLDNLLGGKKYMNTRDDWIQALLDIPDIADMLNSRISERVNETKKASRAVPPAQRFALLREFCINENRLPRHKETYAGTKIGIFLDSLLHGKRYLNTRDAWIQELLDIPEITDKLRMRLGKRGQEVPEEPNDYANVETENEFSNE